MKNTIKFESWQEMLAYLHTGRDIYNPMTELYCFEYNEAGAVCSYCVDIFEAFRLLEQAVMKHDFWSAFLGPNGDIWDAPDDEMSPPNPGCSNIEFCCDRYEGEWIDVTPPNMEETH